MINGLGRIWSGLRVFLKGYEKGQRFMKADRSIPIEDAGASSAQESRTLCLNCRPPTPLEFDYGMVVWYCERCGFQLDEGE
jgi:hypothetical protein